MLGRIAFKALRTLTPVGSSVIEAAGVEATGIVLALVEGATVGVGVASGSRRTLAGESSVLIDTPGPRPAGVAQTLVEVNTLKHDQIEVWSDDLFAKISCH